MRLSRILSTIPVISSWYMRHIDRGRIEIMFGDKDPKVFINDVPADKIMLYLKIIHKGKEPVAIDFLGYYDSKNKKVSKIEFAGKQSYEELDKNRYVADYTKAYLYKDILKCPYLGGYDGNTKCLGKIKRKVIFKEILEAYKEAPKHEINKERKKKLQDIYSYLLNK